MKTVCIKIGGSTVDTEGLLQDLGKSILPLLSEIFPIIIHGGGKDIAQQLQLMNREFSFVDGMRVTDAETVKVVQMVLSGDVNKRIVNALLMQGVRAIGLSGVDASLFTASKLHVHGRDIGLVGKIDAVDLSIIDLCKSGGLIPVISPVSRDISGCIYNVNADLAASELAVAINADDLIFISDVPGVLIEGSVCKKIKISEIETMIQKGQITGGMVPKLRSAADAVRRGVGQIHICGWNDSRTLMNELMHEDFSGTIIFN